MRLASVERRHFIDEEAIRKKKEQTQHNYPKMDMIIDMIRSVSESAHYKCLQEGKRGFVLNRVIQRVGLTVL